MSPRTLPSHHITHDFILKERMLTESDFSSTGGARIFGPDGQLLAEAKKGVETAIHADIETSHVREERQNFDPTGHHSRPDVSVECQSGPSRLSRLQRVGPFLDGLDFFTSHLLLGDDLNAVHGLSACFISGR